MRNILLSGLIALVLSGCVVYPSRPLVAYYDGVEYFYDPAPTYVSGELVVGLYIVDHDGHRHYHYIPRNRWHEPVRHHR